MQNKTVFEAVFECQYHCYAESNVHLNLRYACLFISLNVRVGKC